MLVLNAIATIYFRPSKATGANPLIFFGKIDSFCKLDHCITEQ